MSAPCKAPHPAASAPAMGSLRIYQHDNPDAFRFRPVGALAGDGVWELDRCWGAALSILKARPVIVDLSSVACLDETGRRLLLRMRDAGVRFTSSGSPWDLDGFTPLQDPDPPAAGLRGFWPSLRLAFRRPDLKRR